VNRLERRRRFTGARLNAALCRHINTGLGGGFRLLVWASSVVMDVGTWTRGGVMCVTQERNTPSPQKRKRICKETENEANNFKFDEMTAQVGFESM